MKNRGKEFEKMFENATKDLRDSGYPVDIQRLYDIIGKKTIDQPADYICYRKPNIIYVECKSTYERGFGFYRQKQYNRLLEKSKIDGVIAGMLVWFIDLKRVFWINIEWLDAYNKIAGRKSVAMTVLEKNVFDGLSGVIEIDQKSVRINPVMNLESFYNKVIER